MYITIQTHPTQIVISIFLTENPVFRGFLKIISLQTNYLALFVRISQVIRYQRLDILHPHTQISNL